MILLSKEDLMHEMRREAHERVMNARNELSAQKERLQKSLNERATVTWVQSACVDIQTARQELDDALEWLGEVLLADNERFYLAYAQTHTNELNKLEAMLKRGCTLEEMIDQNAIVDEWAEKVYTALRRYAKHTAYTIGDL